LNKSEWLAVREWDCPNCGKHLDRDINAAQVILQKGLAIRWIKLGSGRALANSRNLCLKVRSESVG
ncbi:transposase, partial [Limosilactobacillus reuteri]